MGWAIAKLVAGGDRDRRDHQDATVGVAEKGDATGIARLLIACIVNTARSK